LEKNILMLTASPRKNGNSDKLADSWMKGARQAGHRVNKFETAFMKIGGCTACNTCWSTDTACTVKDDFNKLEPYLENCEVLVLASPLYWFSFPAQLKGVIDRLYAYGGEGGLRPLTIRQSVLLLCGEDTDAETYRGAIEMYRNIGRFLEWEDRGVLQAGGLSGKNDIDGTWALARAEEMGRDI